MQGMEMASSTLRLLVQVFTVSLNRDSGDCHCLAGWAQVVRSGPPNFMVQTSLSIEVFRDETLLVYTGALLTRL